MKLLRAVLLAAIILAAGAVAACLAWWFAGLPAWRSTAYGTTDHAIFAADGQSFTTVHGYWADENGRVALQAVR